MGDVVHALPAVMDIKNHLPNAQVDWVVERAFAPLLEVSPVVDNVISCEIRRWRKTFWTSQTRREVQAFKHQLQKKSYDAIIDLQGLSKSAFVSWLAKLNPNGRRFAIGNQTDGSSYEFLTRWVADKPIEVQNRVHAVERSRIICSKALNFNYLDNSDENESLNKVKSALTVVPSGTVLPKTIALIHASSRADKTWPLTYWTKLGEALMSKGFNIALPQGSDFELEQARAISNTLVGSKVWLKMGLDEVTAHLAACVGVIGVDSGLSHIAEALDLPLVQIYNFETNWRTGPIRNDFQTSIYANPTPSPEDVLAKWDLCWNLFAVRKDYVDSIAPSVSIDFGVKSSNSQFEVTAPLEAQDSTQLNHQNISNPILKETTERKKVNPTPPSPQLGLFD